MWQKGGEPVRIMVVEGPHIDDQKEYGLYYLLLVLFMLFWDLNSLKTSMYNVKTGCDLRRNFKCIISLEKHLFQGFF